MVTTSHHWSLSIPKRFLFLLLQCTSCRRAMVNKIWCQDVVRKLFHRKEEPLPHGRLFSEPKCQKHVATWYLLYRGLIFAAWVTIMVCSIFQFGTVSTTILDNKWPIFLTNWDLVLGVSQALFGLFLTSRRWKLQKASDFDSRGLTLGLTEKVYWFLFVVTMNTALCVSITYWCGVYDPKIHHLDPLNYMLHVCNSILMIIDFVVTSIPFKLKNFWWCLTIVFLYVTFSLIYYLAGGLDRNGHHYIYKILDWKKPLQTTWVCIVEAVFTIVVHFIICLLDGVKHRLYAKAGRKSFDLTQTPVSEKRTDIV
ncbi:protein rolling stone isoform X2 [Nomia melanderi]|uniref:protein rolling stone isoform X2 n=1 Tax=Nomia melanderi TaxID=2448451 RepID=UPI001303F828|nr:protein rolling stone-like isoform X2 [Nomia melanderi]